MPALGQMAEKRGVHRPDGNAIRCRVSRDEVDGRDVARETAHRFWVVAHDEAVDALRGDGRNRLSHVVVVVPKTGDGDKAAPEEFTLEVSQKFHVERGLRAEEKADGV